MGPSGDPVNDALLGLVTTLVVGSYLYTFYQGRDLRREIAELWAKLNNHIAHRLTNVEARVTQLEQHRADRQKRRKR